MKLTKRYAIFDLDGTLLDTLDDLTDSMNYILGKHNFTLRTRDEVRNFVGNGVRKLVERAVPPEYKADDRFIDKFYDDFSLYYNSHSDIKTAPYPGTLDMLDKLLHSGFDIAIVSNKIDSAVKSLSTKFFGERIKSAIGEKPSVRHKPEPDMVFMAMEEMGADKENSIYIGDSEVDIQTAKNAGIPCISVLWGFKDRNFLEDSGATTIVESMEELGERLVNYQKSQNN